MEEKGDWEEDESSFEAQRNDHDSLEEEELSPLSEEDFSDVCGHCRNSLVLPWQTCGPAQYCHECEETSLHPMHPVELTAQGLQDCGWDECESEEEEAAKAEHVMEASPEEFAIGTPGRTPESRATSSFSPTAPATSRDSPDDQWHRSGEDPWGGRRARVAAAPVSWTGAPSLHDEVARQSSEIRSKLEEMMQANAEAERRSAGDTHNETSIPFVSNVGLTPVAEEAVMGRCTHKIYKVTP